LAQSILHQRQWQPLSIEHQGFVCRGCEDGECLTADHGLGCLEEGCPPQNHAAVCAHRALCHCLDPDVQCHEFFQPVSVHPHADCMGRLASDRRAHAPGICFSWSVVGSGTSIGGDGDCPPVFLLCETTEDSCR